MTVADNLNALEERIADMKHKAEAAAAYLSEGSDAERQDAMISLSVYNHVIRDMIRSRAELCRQLITVSLRYKILQLEPSLYVWKEEP